MPENIPTKEIAEMLDSVSDKVPKLIKGLVGTVYSAEAGREMGKAVGAFYSEMVQAGIPPKGALNMAKDYMLSMKNIAGMVNTMNQADKAEEQNGTPEMDE